MVEVVATVVLDLATGEAAAAAGLADVVATATTSSTESVEDDSSTEVSLLLTVVTAPPIKPGWTSWCSGSGIQSAVEEDGSSGSRRLEMIPIVAAATPSISPHPRSRTTAGGRRRGWAPSTSRTVRCRAMGV